MTSREMKQYLWLGIIQVITTESCFPCPDNWNKVKINSKTECLRNIGDLKVEKAAKTCDKKGGKLPVTIKENSDLETQVQKLWPEVFQFVIDLNDVITESRWMNSGGKLTSFFNWFRGRQGSHFCPISF